MPHITVSSNKKIGGEAEEKVKAAFGMAIEVFPRKTEQWLMCEFQPESTIFFQGKKQDAVFIKVEVFGKIDKEAANAFTQEATRIVEAHLGILPENIYIAYFETPYWGWNGKNF